MLSYGGKWDGTMLMEILTVREKKEVREEVTAGMKRFISLPAVGKRVSLRNYVSAIKVAKENPDLMFRHGLTTWWPVTGAEILRQFRAGMHDRITQAIPWIKRGCAEMPPKGGSRGC